ncbi:MAG: (Fe-S)-binding protein [Peptococcaceae bacterium]|nr:(Fe-S)-binding protein [Peptococcaceae bacterium]
MSASIKLDAKEEYLKKCVRCGQCRYVCPVLAEAGREPASPRGKVYLAGLLQKGEISPGRQAERILSLCLTCGACAAECPSGLPVDRIIKAARALTAEARPYSPHRLIFRQIFARQHLLGSFPAFAAALKKLADPWLGLAPGKPARSRIPVISVPENRKPRLKVGYFLGCATNHLLPEVALSTVRVLRHLGCEVITPPSHCCGLPLETAGERDLARRLLDENRRIFGSFGLDAVVTDCSSCSHHLTENGFGLHSQPVYEFSEFLAGVLNPPRPSRELEGGAVACHDPCHLRYGRKLGGRILQVLDLIPGIAPVEIPGGSACCGGGGTFSLKHRALSAGILGRYAARIKSSGAQRVATACPSCTIQLDRGLKASGISVCHPAQLFYASYGLSG